MVRRSALVALIIGLVTPAHAQQQMALSDIAFNSLFIEVSVEDSNFTVVDARMDENYTAGAFFGVVGAGLSSAGAAGQDDKKADIFREGAAQIDLSSMLRESIIETLSSSDNLNLMDDKASASHTLLVEIRNWGLLRKSQENREMRTFLNLTLEIINNRGQVVWEKKRENAVSEKSALFETYTDEIIEAEMAALAKKTGQFIAYQIIYR